MTDTTTDAPACWRISDEYPFLDDEYGNITGYGHQDPEQFAAAVRAFDVDPRYGAAEEDSDVTAADVKHQWVILTNGNGVPDGDGEHFEPVPADHDAAIPVTTVWGGSR